MKCEQCESEATVHETRVVSGKRVERHLCEKCARNEGIAVQVGMSVPEMIEKMLEQATQAGPTETAGPKAEAPKVGTCPVCANTYAEFKRTGLLGCPECYRAFEPQLGPLLERAHEGGTHHVGKVPKRALTGAREAGANPVESVLGGPEQRAGKAAALRKQLEDAVRAEQYERAAAIRDELRRFTDMEGMHPSAHDPSPPAPPPPPGGMAGSA